MKQFLFSLFLLIGFTISYSQTATDLNIHDTRSTNLPPLSYSTYPGHAGLFMRTRFDFKDRNVIGVPGSGSYSTLMTMPQWGDNSGDKMHQLNFNNGGIFYRQGWPNATNWENWQKLVVENENGKVGIGINNPSSSLELFSVDNTGTRINPHNVLTITAENNNYPYSGFGGGIVFKNRTYNAGVLTGARMRSVINYDGYQGQDYGTSLAFDVTPTINSSLTEAIRIRYNGNVGIGTTTPTEKLSVNGNIRAKKLIVTQQNWSDYVFYKGYKLRPLHEVEKYIKQHQHLPEVPSAKEVQSNGISVGDTQALLLKKIEELTLYIITQNKTINKLTERVAHLEKNKL